MPKKPLTNNQIYGKVLSSDELISYIFDKSLPQDIEIRIERWRKANCKTTDPSVRRQVKALKAGLSIDQLKPGLTWHRIALILPIKRCHCTTCDSHYESPCGSPMVKAKHERLGTHFKRPEEGLDLSDLPRELYYLHEEISACPNCFIEQEDQLSLPLKETNNRN